MGECHYLYGNHMTVKRIRFLQALLDFIGLGGRLHLEWISSAEADRFVRVVTRFTESVRALGPNPLAQFTSWAREGTMAGTGQWTGRKSGKPVITRDQRLVDQIKAGFLEGRLDLFLGYRDYYGHPLPHCFSRDRPDDLDRFVIGAARYPFEAMAIELLAEEPDLKIGILGRDCSSRGLNVLTTWDRVGEHCIEIIGVTCCPGGRSGETGCSYLSPAATPSPGDQDGIGGMDICDVERLPPKERLSRWMYEFQKCIKCYGCRNICPVCFCRECSLEHGDLVQTGEVPPEVPLFHLVRAVHMAGRCVDCGLCEEACPMDIPLRLLYRWGNRMVRDLFGYEAPVSRELSPFNVLGRTEPLEPLPLDGKGGVPGEN